jgi:dipeptidyl aminopeptidase/acylaminoacyl peptidase
MDRMERKHLDPALQNEPSQTDLLCAHLQPLRPEPALSRSTPAPHAPSPPRYRTLLVSLRLSMAQLLAASVLLVLATAAYSHPRSDADPTSSLSPRGLPFVLATSLIAVIGSSTCTNLTRQGRKGSALPYELAFTMKTPLGDARQALSSDGNWLAYAVHTPLVQGSQDDLPRPEGTPEDMVGCRLYVTETATGVTRPAGPAKGNSWRPSWSPDSQLVVFLCDAGGVPQLWVYDLSKQETRRVSEAPLKPSPWEGDEAYWSPDGTEVYVRLGPSSPQEPEQEKEQKRRGAGGKLTVTVYDTGGENGGRKEETGPDTDRSTAVFLRRHNAALGAIHVKSGSVRTVVPADATPRPAVLRLSPSGKWVSYLSVYRLGDPEPHDAVYDLAIASSRGGQVYTLASRLPLADNAWGWTYRWHPSRDLLVYLKDRRLWIVDFSQGAALEPRQLAAELGDLAPTPLVFTRDGTRVLVGASPVDLADYAGPRPTDLALVPLDGSKATIISPGREYRVHSAALTANPQTLWQPDPKFLTLGARDVKTNEIVILRFDLENRKAVVHRKEHCQFQWIGSSSDHGPLVAIYENGTVPPDFYQFANDFAGQRRLTHIEPRLDSVGVGTVATYETPVTRYDGKQIRVPATILLPPGAKQGDRLPTLVIVYPGAGMSTYVDRFGGGSPLGFRALVFTSRGYAVLLPDAPIGPEGAAGNPILEATDVLLPQVYRAAELGYTDIQNVAVIGHSYGGYGAAGVVAYTNLFRAAIAMSGMYDLPGNHGRMEEGGTNFGGFDFETGQKRMGTHPWADLNRYITNSPYYQADRIHTPLLLIHGEKDNTPWQEAAKMFNALKRLGRTAQLALYAGEGHRIRGWSLANGVDACQRIVAFIEKYMAPGERRD